MILNLRKSHFAITIALTLMTSGYSLAQSSDEQDASRSFTPDDFTQYAPRTALDMLQRIPGFQLQSGNTVRGLGQGGANVLLNGQQITGKGDDAFAQVGRVSAANVIRIEIVDGATLDITGLTGQVANVFTENTGIAGTWEWRPQWRDGLKAYLFAFNTTVSGETGNLAYSAEISNDGWRGGHWGPEQQYSSSGVLLRTLDEKATYDGDNPTGTVNLTWTPKENHTGHFNVEYGISNFNQLQRSYIHPDTDVSQTGLDRFTFSEDEWSAKVDGDYELPLMGGKLKTIGYYRFERSETYARSKHFALSTSLENHNEYHQVADEAEIIGRTEYSWSPREGRDWEIAAEGAFNSLDIGANFFDFTGDQEFPSGSRVEELRSEGTLTHTRTLFPKWDLQVSLGGEYSKISQGLKEREFIRPKGFISTTYKPGDDFSIRTKIERDVGQLNFFDFVDSVNLEDNVNSTGNSDLVPSQTWLGEIEFDKQFSGGHSVKARFHGEMISDLVDRIPIGLDGDAVGNIDKAHRYGVELNSTLKGEFLGLNGMELKTLLRLQNSSVDDPLGAFSRNLNGDLKSFWQIGFRHDLPNSDLAWGFMTDRASHSAVYRLNTISRSQRDVPWTSAYIEHKDILGMKAELRLINLLGASHGFERDIFDNRRDIGQIIRYEDRTRELGPFLRLTLSGAF